MSNDITSPSTRLLSLALSPALFLNRLIRFPQYAVLLSLGTVLSHIRLNYVHKEASAPFSYPV